MRMARTVVVAVVAQVLAPFGAIFLSGLYQKWTGLADDWLAPIVGAAFVLAVEPLALFLVLTRQAGLIVLLLWTFAVAGSWVTGLVVFFALDRSLTHWAPTIGLAASTIALAILAWRMTKAPD